MKLQPDIFKRFVDGVSNNDKAMAFLANTGQLEFGDKATGSKWFVQFTRLDEENKYDELELKYIKALVALKRCIVCGDDVQKLYPDADEVEKKRELYLHRLNDPGYKIGPTKAKKIALEMGISVLPRKTSDKQREAMPHMYRNTHWVIKLTENAQ